MLLSSDFKKGKASLNLRASSDPASSGQALVKDEMNQQQTKIRSCIVA